MSLLCCWCQFNKLVHVLYQRVGTNDQSGSHSECLVRHYESCGQTLRPSGTCDSATVLRQVVDLHPIFAFLLIDVYHIVVGTYCNFCIEENVQEYQAL